MKEEITIVIVDDHHIFRSGLQLLLEANKNFRVVGECETVEEACEVIRKVKPDLVLLDLNLKDGDSLGIITDIPQLSPQTRILVLTSEHDLSLHGKCLKLGASGLVLKEKSSELLFQAIEAVKGGDLWFDPKIMEKVLLEYTRPAADKEANKNLDKIKSLTTREMEVITLVGEGLKNKAIADRLFISETTVRHHLTSAFGKLGINSRLELVIFAFKHKLVKIPD